MEVKDQAAVEELCNSNPRFRMLYEEHQILEKELTVFEEKMYLSPDEEIERKKLMRSSLLPKSSTKKAVRSASPVMSSIPTVFSPWALPNPWLFSKTRLDLWIATRIF